MLLNVFLYSFGEVAGCSHQHLRAELEAYRDNDGQGSGHLCSASPCTLPLTARPTVHLGSTAVAGRADVLNVTDLAQLSSGGRVEREVASAALGAAP